MKKVDLYLFEKIRHQIRNHRIDFKRLLIIVHLFVFFYYYYSIKESTVSKHSENIHITCSIELIIFIIIMRKYLPPIKINIPGPMRAVNQTFQ